MRWEQRRNTFSISRWLKLPTAIDRKRLTREVSRVTSCAQRRWLRLQSDHRRLVGNYTLADTQRPVLTWREGKHWAPSASSARCQSKEIAPPEWKLKSSVFLIEPNAGLTSQESELWLFHLPTASGFLHQRKRVECHSEPSNFIWGFISIYLSILSFFFFFLAIPIFAHCVLFQSRYQVVRGRSFN